MDHRLYPMIFKRKSFHLFRNLETVPITDEDITEIQKAYQQFIPLYPDIKTEICFVPAEESGCNRGEEYCIYLYSEKKENYLANIGYLGEQLDLYLVSRNIATLWFGIGKPQEITRNGLAFVIMIAAARIADETKFRKDMYKSKRKPAEEVWQGAYMEGVTDIVRYAPSACNTQPWLVRNEGDLYIYRYKKQGKRGIMPADKVSLYNRIDLGIFLCFVDLCLEHQGISMRRELFPDHGEDQEYVLNAVYHCERKQGV